MTIGLKGGAYLLTGSVGLLSDALESIVNLVTAIVTMIALTIAARPADEEHAYGHTKAEYFASGFQGGLIVIVAVVIAAAAVYRFIHPRPIEEPGLGLGISVIAALVNLGTALLLQGAAERYDSIALESDARHILADVWTTGGVLIGVGAAALTGWLWLDSLAAIAVAIHIIQTGVDLLRRSALGLLDTALPEETRARIEAILESHVADGIRYHALRTRQAGVHRFISLHILVPGDWTVQKGHDLLEVIEGEIREVVPNSTVFTHLEPIEDPVSWLDIELRREE